jgi:hypothetical protein
VFSLNGEVGDTYRLHVEDLGVDDHAESAAAATPLPLATPVSGRLHVYGDMDAFLLTLDAQRLYRVSAVDAAGFPVRFTVQGPGGSPIAESWDYAVAGTTPPLTFKTLAAGSYLLEVRARQSGHGDYRLRVDDAGLDDHGDDLAHASPLPEGVEVASIVDTESDRDVFVFQALAGHAYHVHCATLPNSFGSVILSDAAGQYLEGRTCQVSGVVTLSARRDVTEPLFVTVSGDGGSDTTGKTFRLTLEDAGFDEHGDTVETATALGDFGEATGGLQLPSDRDVFTFTLPAGRLFGVKVTGSTADALVVVRDASGQQVYGGPGWPSAKGRATGERYSAEVYAYPGGRPGGYTLSVVELPPDDHGDTVAGATPLVRGVPMAGVMEIATDRDVFTLALSAGEQVVVDLRGSWWLSGQGSTPDGTYVVGYSPGNGASTFTAPVSGTYSFTVNAPGGDLAYGDGQYTLKVY